MSSDRPRPATDDEESPLLNGGHDEQPSFRDRVLALTHEPLTPLLRVLLVAAIVLLVLLATFIGLFAGAEHKLAKRDGRGTPETTATLTTTVLATTTVMSTTTVLVPTPGPTPNPSETPCLTTECIILASQILSSLDTSQDPCSEFYQFANGGWMASHPLPSDKGRFGSFDALSLENKQIIHQILESENDDLDPSDAESMGKIRSLYNSCLDEQTIADLGAEPLLRLAGDLRRILSKSSSAGTNFFYTIATQGQQPLAADSKHSLTSALAWLHSRGVNALFAFDIDGDAGEDPDAMTLQFSQPTLGLPSKEYYLEDDSRELYIHVVERVLLALSADEPESKGTTTSHKPLLWPPWPWPPWDDKEKPENKSTRAHRLANEVFELESRLAEAGADLDVLVDDPIATYNPVSLSQLSASLPQVDLPTYLAAFAPRSYPSRVIVQWPPYVSSLSEILSNTTTEVLEAYFLMQIALEYAPHLSMDTEAWQAVRELEEALKGLKKGVVTERSEWCMTQVDKSLGFSVGRFFVQKTFGGDSRDKGTKVIIDIIDAFTDSLSKLDWMDDESAKAAAEKAQNLRVMVGYPMSPNTESSTAIANYYRLLKFDKHAFFDNLVASAVFQQLQTWVQLGRRRDLNRMLMSPATANAYFIPPANQIVFPAGILRPPFFQSSWPSYLSYGAFGQVAAHELTHAFDSAGRLYNQHGRLEEWWTNHTSDAFNVRAACLSRQYSAYPVPDGKGNVVYVNGNLTSGENIGDTGLIQAYRAWQAQYNESHERGGEYLLPGLNFTRSQLFFIAFGRIWAQQIKPATALQRIRTDPHSPAKYRVEGTVFNIKEFAEAFNCSANAKLNPPREKQCIFW